MSNIEEGRTRVDMLDEHPAVTVSATGSWLDAEPQDRSS